jgi:hypothetical protein
MLAQLETPHNDFAALAEYLVRGRDNPPNPKRVAWTYMHNIPFDDPVLAAKIMAATADLSRRCENACFHATINWHPEEQPTPEIMQEIARRTLDMAGLAEHQALIMGHGDKPYAHLHMMINRVHPETGRAWSTFRNYERFDRIMKQLAGEFGFQYVPCHAFEPELTDNLFKHPDSNATYAARRGAKTNRLQWPKSASRAYGAQINECIERATSWDDLEYLFAEDHLTLEAKGRGRKKGLVVGDGSSYTKFSALKLTSAAQSLTRKFGKSFAAHKADRQACSRPPTNRSVWSIDRVDLARALGTREDVRDEINAKKAIRKARLAKKAVLDQLVEEMKENWRAATYLRPAARRRATPRSQPTRQRSQDRHR